MVAAPYNFPANFLLRIIEQQFLPILTRDDPLFEHFPIGSSTEYLLRWRQWDNFKGLQQARGLGNEPEKVDLPGLNEFEMVPGSYGEYTPIGEEVMLKAAKPGVAGQTLTNIGEPIDINEWLRVAKPNLMSREITRIKYIIWQLLLNGTFSVADPRGAVIERDTFPIQTFTAATSWSNLATSTPLGNLRAIKLKARGYSTSFGRDARLFANQDVVNSLLMNANAADLQHIRTEYGATLNDLEANNRIFAANDLPQVVVYDSPKGGYYDDNGVFQLYVGPNKAVVFGTRPNNALVGEYLICRNFVNPDLQGGSYDRIIDQRMHGRLPGSIEAHRGHNGGPTCFYPSSIISMNL